jgi:HD-GYP domain-containing protein (c-di-GMP phosphodiesterase class II)
MDTSKGSIILKTIATGADEAQLVAYLGKRAKSIPPGKIPVLLKNLPVVLSRNVPQATGAAVINQLEQLVARALFLPAGVDAEETLDTVGAKPTSKEGSACQGDTTDADHLGFQMLLDSLRQAESQRTLKQKAMEVLIIALLLGSTWALNYTVASQYLLLGLYTLPTILTAYFYGRRQAIFAAVASIVLVLGISAANPEHFERIDLAGPGGASQWRHILSWGAILMLTAWLAGALHEYHKTGSRELRRTYHGLVLILKHFITQDEDRENHAFRVSVYAARIATQMGLVKEYIEDIRTAARLHDLGRQKTSRAVLDKVACLSRDAQVSIAGHLPLGPEHLTPLGDSLGRILPMLVNVNAAAERLKILPNKRPALPLGAKILAVADTYDTLISPGPNSPVLSPLEARKQIMAKAGSEFDAEVVHAFAMVFDRGEMELPGAII